MESLNKMDEKLVESSGKFYLYSLLYLINKEDRASLDSSYFYINKSKYRYPDSDIKEIEVLEELNISISTIDSIIQVIDSIEFNFVFDVNSIDDGFLYSSSGVPTCSNFPSLSRAILSAIAIASCWS